MHAVFNVPFDFQTGSSLPSAFIRAPAAGASPSAAQYELGQLYFTATGVTRDYIAACVWFTVAAGQTSLPDNRKPLLELHNIAGARLTAAQVSEAERRAGAWKPSR